MSEQAAPAAAPAAPAPNGAPAPSAPVERVHAGDSFQDFQAQVAERLKAQQQRNDQPPPLPKTVQPQPKPPVEAQPPEPQSQTLDSTPQEPEKPAEQQQAEPQITPEDLELLKKVKAWMEGDTIPDEFGKKLVALKNGDDIEYETFDEVRAGRMRQRDYTRAMQQHQKERENWEAERGYYKGHFQAIFDDAEDGAAGGNAMYEIFTRAGKRKQLLALGAKLAAEEQEDIDGANGMGLALMRRKGIKDPQNHEVQEAIKKEFQRRQQLRDQEAKGRANEFEVQRLRQAQEQRQQQNQHEEFYAAQRKSLEQLRPRAFEALGLNHEDPLHQQRFGVYLDAVIRQENAQKVTPEIVMKAARCVKEEVEDDRKRRAAPGGAAKPAPQPFQPQLGAGGGKAPAASQKQQWHAENFAERFLPQWK